jgi:predicted transcriptional regulator
MRLCVIGQRWEIKVDEAISLSKLEGGDGSALPKVVSIVSAYVSNNSLRAADLPDLIGSVHLAIRQLSQSAAPTPEKVPDAPAVPIKKSVTKDYIICLEDGKKFKSLRRHLSSSYNMTPDEYRTKWGLANDYPMVAPSYSATRSQLAKDSGLGQVSRVTTSALAAPVADAPKKARGRPRKAG